MKRLRKPLTLLQAKSNWILAAASFSVVIFFYGAVPGLALPTLGQSVWLGGFARSLSDADTFSIWAYNIGGSEASPLMFGLPAAVPMAFLIKAGLHTADAYSLSFALWYLISFFGAYTLLRTLNVRQPESILGSMLWLMLPVVHQHSGYSALSISLALLPLYIYTSLRCISNPSLKNLSILVGAAIISIFMDGYGFIFFASCHILIVCIRGLFSRSFRYVNVLFFTIAFGTAYILYASYIGETSYSPANLNSFRGWGLDLSFAVWPTEGLFFLPDYLKFSLPRYAGQFFGDSSVFRTSFSLFILVPAVILFYKNYGDRSFKRIFFVILIFGFYMALGPSIKWMSFRPDGQPSTMAAEFAVGPTGTGWISSYIPGFNNLRASYRWIAVALLGAWIVCFVSLSDPRLNRLWSFAFAISCLAIVLPYPVSSWRDHVTY